MFKKSLLLVLYSLGMMMLNDQNASANWTYWDHYDSLEPESNDLGHGHRYELYFVHLQQGERVWIWQLSSQIDSYLYLISPDGTEAARDDDSAGGQSYSHSIRDAFIHYNAPVEGWYIILASSYHPNEYGGFRLWVYEDD